MKNTNYFYLSSPNTKKQPSKPSKNNTLTTTKSPLNPCSNSCIFYLHLHLVQLNRKNHRIWNNLKLKKHPKIPHLSTSVYIERLKNLHIKNFWV